VKIGERVNFEDFTVGVTSNKNQADFIITNSTISDFSIKASVLRQWGQVSTFDI
jgi:hypothetical protein